MRCPYCESTDNRVLDSRMTDEGHSVRRRRECSCGRRFTTYERFEESLLMVAKKDKRREKFDRSKVLRGVLRACEKRPVSGNQIEQMVTAVERSFRQQGKNEVTVEQIGEEVMERLRALDDVAYVRYASVYKEFKDVSRFIEELKVLEAFKNTQEQET